MKKPPAPKQRIGLTAQSPQIYCQCKTPQAVYNASDSRQAVRFCLRCRLIVWR